MGYTSSSNSKARLCFVCRFATVACRLLSFLRRSDRQLLSHNFPPEFYFSILNPHQRGMGTIALKGRKKAADCSFLVIMILTLLLQVNLLKIVKDLQLWVLVMLQVQV